MDYFDELGREILIHPRVQRHHPQLSENDVKSAWKFRFADGHRHSQPGVVVAIGSDSKNRNIEIVAKTSAHLVLNYHAHTPPTPKVLKELHLDRRSTN